jgi:hypothetical protein
MNSEIETIIKVLPVIVRPKGTGLPGLTATLVQRTEQVAWFVRSDGYFEVFLIKIGMSFDGSELMEYYPGTNDFGKTAWCIRDKMDAARYYSNLCLGQPVDE